MARTLRFAAISIAAAAVIGCGEQGLRSYRDVECPPGTRIREPIIVPYGGVGCELPDGRPHGPYARWDSAGAIVSRSESRYGKRHGRSTRYHPNGQKCKEGDYKDAKPVGRWTWWDENGEVRQVTDYGRGRGRTMSEVRYRDGVAVPRPVMRAGDDWTASPHKEYKELEPKCP